MSDAILRGLEVEAASGGWPEKAKLLQAQHRYLGCVEPKSFPRCKHHSGLRPRASPDGPGQRASFSVKRGQNVTAKFQCAECSLPLMGRWEPSLPDHYFDNVGDERIFCACTLCVYRRAGLKAAPGT